MAVTAKRDLAALALAPSETEQKKAERTHNMIREHLESDEGLKKYKITTYLQGSYKNSTTVRGDSDVDMGCIANAFFYHDVSQLPHEETSPGFGQTKSLRKRVEEAFSNSPLSWDEYRKDVFNSLKAKYGTVVSGNKAITVAGNTSRLDADVLPCAEFRWYYKSIYGEAKFHTGIAFFTTTGSRVINFPHQHFENLGTKDRSNGGKVKGCIRIIKRLRNELEEAKKWDRKRSPSCHLESLVWNAPSSKFDGGYPTVVQNVLAHLYNDLKAKKHDSESLRSYMQANDIFVLFHPEFWNVDDAIAFIDVIWESAFFS